MTQNIRFDPLVQCQVLPRRGYDERSLIALLDSFKTKINEAEKTKTFKARCYKLMTMISTKKEMSTTVTAVFDTGTSLYLIREDVLPTLRLADVQPIRVRVKAAGNKAFRVEGGICYSVEIGGHKAKEAFGVVPKLAA